MNTILLHCKRAIVLKNLLDQKFFVFTNELKQKVIKAEFMSGIEFTIAECALKIRL